MHKRPITPEIEIVSYKQDESSSSNKSLDNYSISEEEQIDDGELDISEVSEIVDDESSYDYENISDFHSDSISNRDEHLFHMNLLSKVVSNIPIHPKKYKNGTRKSLSFTNNQMRDIEYQNRILLQKILEKGPNYAKPKYSSTPNLRNSPRVTSAAINRKKQQRKIDLDNQILKRKIEDISRRRK